VRVDQGIMSYIPHSVQLPALSHLDPSIIPYPHSHFPQSYPQYELNQNTPHHQPPSSLSLYQPGLNPVLTSSESIFDRESIMSTFHQRLFPKQHQFPASFSSIPYLKPKPLYGFDITHSTAPYYISSKLSQSHQYNQIDQTSPQQQQQQQRQRQQPGLNDIAYISSVLALKTCTLIGGKQAICILPYTPHSLRFGDEDTQNPTHLGRITPKPFHSHLLTSNNIHSSQNEESSSIFKPISYLPVPGHVSHLANQGDEHNNNYNLIFSGHFSGHLGMHDLTTQSSYQIAQLTSPITHISFGQHKLPSCALVTSDSINIIDTRQKDGAIVVGKDKPSKLSADPPSCKEYQDGIITKVQKTLKLQPQLLSNARFGYHLIQTPIERLDNYQTQANPHTRPHRLSNQSPSQYSNGPLMTQLARFQYYGSLGNQVDVRVGHVARKMYRKKNIHSHNDYNYNTQDQNDDPTQAHQTHLAKQQAETEARWNETFVSGFDLDSKFIDLLTSPSYYWHGAFNPYGNDYEVIVGGMNGVSLFDLRMAGKEVCHYNPCSSLHLGSIVQVQHHSHSDLEQYTQYYPQKFSTQGLEPDGAISLNASSQSQHCIKRPKQSSKLDTNYDHNDRNHSVCFSDKYSHDKAIVSLVEPKRPPQYSKYTKVKHYSRGVTSAYFIDNTHLVCTTIDGQVLIYSTLDRQQEQHSKQLVSTFDSSPNNSVLMSSRQKEGPNKTIDSKRSLHDVDCGIAERNNQNITDSILPLGFGRYCNSAIQSEMFQTKIKIPILKSFFLETPNDKLLFLPLKNSVTVISLHNLKEMNIIYESSPLPNPTQSSSGPLGDGFPSIPQTPFISLKHTSPVTPSHTTSLPGVMGLVTCVYAVIKDDGADNQNGPQNSEKSFSHFFSSASDNSNLQSNWSNNVGIIAGCVDGSVLIWK